MGTPPPVKLSFGGLKKPIIKTTNKLSTIKKSAFSFTDADEDLPPPLPINAGKASTSKLYSSNSIGITPTQPKVSTATLSRQQKLKQAEDLKLDKTVYEYDEVYDNMKEGSRVAELEKKKDSGERKPKYIERLMQTAEVRKRDRVRAEDKMVQREREKEGEEFADKDEFVTPSYLAQQEELRKIEVEETKKEAASGGKSLGMSSFYKTYLDSSAAAHDAAVAASLAVPSTSNSTDSFKINAPAPLSEAQQAAEFTAKTGKKIEVNDDGIIIDKRELLSGGLNIVKKPKLGPHLPGSESTGGGFSAAISARDTGSNSSGGAGGLNLPVGLSAAERSKQSRERHSREVERQMVELEKKRKRAEEEEANEVKVNKSIKRNDETKIMELKRKAEERRLKREEDARNAPKEV